jgi:putative peptidoglycan lipid II flippase
MKIGLAKGPSIRRAGRGMALATLTSRAVGFVRLVVLAGARGREKILVDGQLSPGSRTAEILLGGQVISVSAT